MKIVLVLYDKKANHLINVVGVCFPDRCLFGFVVNPGCTYCTDLGHRFVDNKAND